MQIEWSKGEVLKLAGSARWRRRGWGKVWEGDLLVEDGVKEGAKYGSGQEQGGRERSAVSRAGFSSCGRTLHETVVSNSGGERSWI
jgi:hypothetical protein